MTNEQAINMLKSKMSGHTDTSYEWSETVRMAVRSLEQQPCEDAISRQAVLDMIENAQIITDGEFCGYCTEDIDINILPPVTPQPTRWIPVSERLPEESYAVLVWCPERKNIYCAYREENQWWIFGAYFEKVRLDVIAWMPLSEPYHPDINDGKMAEREE